MEKQFLEILKTTLIITSVSTFCQYFVSFYLEYREIKIKPWWWAFPTSTGVLLYRHLLNINILNNPMLHIIFLSTFFGFPFAYLCVRNASEDIISEKEAASFECSKKGVFYTLELPLMFSKVKNLITLSFLSTWFKVNVIIPFNSGGMMYSTSNFETYNYYENMINFDIDSGLSVSLESLILAILFSTLLLGVLYAIDRFNIINRIFLRLHIYGFINLNS
jgi:ABC-type Fe3+ transport system permease subunit